MNSQALQFRKFCEDNDIRLDTSVANEEHISNWSKLGIIDRLVQLYMKRINRKIL
jgi:hypothetical protein